jgi:hypothetical protein
MYLSRIEWPQRKFYMHRSRPPGCSKSRARLEDVILLPLPGLGEGRLRFLLALHRVDVRDYRTAAVRNLSSGPAK